MLGLKTTIENRRHQLEIEINEATSYNEADKVRYLNGELKGIDFALTEINKVVHKIKEIVNVIE